MEDFSTHAAEGHRQVVVNTEVMKHVMVMNKASVREIMLQHERTFKEQVQDLHKLYEVQRTLMHKVKTGQSTLLHGPSNSSADNAQSLPEHHENSRSLDSSSSPMSGIGFLRPPDRGNTFDQQGAAAQRDPKNMANSSRKKVIDLEQLPEDDTDDEMERPEDNVTLPSGESTSPVPGHKNANSFLKEDAFSRSAALSYSRHVVEPNFLSNAANIEALNERNIPSGGVTAQSISGTGKTTTTVFSQAGQETLMFSAVKTEPDWLSQGSNVKPLCSDSIQLQEKPTAQILMEGSHADYHQHWGTHQGFQNPTLGQHRTSLLPTENRSHSIGNWSHVYGEKKPEGHIGVPSSSLETPKEPSNSFSPNAYRQSNQYAAVTSGRMVDYKASGDHGHTSSVYVPASVDIPNSSNLQPQKNVWYPQNSAVQFPQYQQQTMFGQHVLENISHTGWLQSSQNVYQNIYPQQVIHSSIHSNDASQIGFRVEELQRGQAGGASCNNMSGMGNYFCTSQNVQKPDFAKPPYMVSKNHDGGMELNVASPEGESKACQKKLSNPSLDYLKCQENRGCSQGDVNSDETKHGRNDLTTLDLHAYTELGVSQMVVTPVSHMSKALATASAPAACDNSDSGYHIPSRIQCDVGVVESLSTKEYSGLSAQKRDSGLQNVKQMKMGLVQNDRLKIMEQPSTSSGKGNSSCFMDATSHQAKEENPDLAMSEQGSHHLIPTNDGIRGTTIANEIQSYTEHSSAARLEETNDLSSAAPMAVDVNLNSPCDDVADTNVGKSRSENCEVDNNVANALRTRDEVDIKPSAESVPTEGDFQSAAARGGDNRKDDVLNRNVHSGTMAGQGSDLSTSSQLTMQAVSMQSSSTDLMPGKIKQERECSSKETENSTFCSVPGKGSAFSTRKRKSVGSGGEHPSLPLEKLTIENKPGVDADESSDNLQQISDNETLAAAAILLSFAVKKTAQSSCKYWKEDASRTTNRGQKHGSAEHAPSSSRQVMVGHNKAGPKDHQYEDVVESSDCQAYTKLKVQCSVKRIDNLGSVRFRLKDRTREEPMQQVLQHHEHGKKEAKSTRTKIPKVVSIGGGGGGGSIDEPVPFPRSKQLNKLNAAAATVTKATAAAATADVYGHSVSHKAKDGHTLTGRRSTRGPPTASRMMHQENRARPPPQYSEHYSDGDGDHPDMETTQSRRRERNAQSPCKFEVGMKSKIWTDMNRRRSRTRTQAPGAATAATFKKAQR